MEQRYKALLTWFDKSLLTWFDKSLLTWFDKALLACFEKVEHTTKDRLEKDDTTTGSKREHQRERRMTVDHAGHFSLDLTFSTRRLNLLRLSTLTSLARSTSSQPGDYLEIMTTTSVPVSLVIVHM